MCLSTDTSHKAFKGTHGISPDIRDWKETLLEGQKGPSLTMDLSTEVVKFPLVFDGKTQVVSQRPSTSV